MKITLTSFQKKDELYIRSFGYEDIWQNARWGRGSRNEYIIHYVLSGEGYFNNVKLKDGQGFLISPGVLHEYHSSIEKPWKYFWITLEGLRAEEIIKKYIQADGGIFNYEFKNELSGLIFNIMKEGSPISEASALGYFFTVMSYHEKEIIPCPNYYINQSEKYIKENLHRPLSVTEIAKLLNINDRYLYNLFIKHKGISPKRYITKQKIEMAKKMLKSTDCTITEIAVSCGFENVLAFSKFFSKSEGISPGNFRKTMLGAVE